MMIIGSKYDTDGYKLTMGEILWELNVRRGMGIQGRYKFVDRDNRVYSKEFVDELQEQVNMMETLSPNPDISRFVAEKWPFMNQEFLRWYDQVFYHDPRQVDLSLTEDKKLNLYVEGPIHTDTHFEIPLLRTISHLVTKNSGNLPQSNWREMARNNAQYLQANNVFYSEFGGRRPFSSEIHQESLREYAKFPKLDGKGGLLGTSWVKYAYDNNLMIMGTMAHEYIQMMAALHGYIDANRMAMITWVNYYGRRLGYYLPDTFTTDVALRDFDKFFAGTFEGTRQDSGNPFEYANKLVSHYNQIGLDPRTKSIIYSNSLKSISEIMELQNYRPGEFRRSFGLGGFISNNVGPKAHNMVLKLVAVRIGNGEWIDVCKLSDDPGKSIGKPEEVQKCKRELRIE